MAINSVHIWAYL